MATLAAITLSPLGTGAVPAQQQPPAESGARIGNFRVIGRYGDLIIELPPPGSTSNVVNGQVTGRGNEPVMVQSPDYEIAAPRIEMTLRPTAGSAGSRSRLKATAAEATGGVKVVVRQVLRSGPTGVQKRVTTLTCNRATYSATTAPTDRGKILLRGNVRSVVEDPAFEGPVVSNSEAGTIEFLPDGKTRIQLNNGSFEATPKETKKNP